MHTTPDGTNKGCGGEQANAEGKGEDEAQAQRKKAEPEERRRAFVERARQGFQGSIASLVSSFPCFPSAAATPAKPTTQGRPRLRRWRFSFSRWPLRFLRLHDQHTDYQGNEYQKKATPTTAPACPEDKIALHEKRNNQQDFEDEDEQLDHEVDKEELRERAVLLANLLVALVCLSIVILPFRLQTEGWRTLNSWCPVVSISVHSSLLMLARWRHDHGRLSAWLECIYFTFLLAFRCAWHGVSEESFTWLPVVPVIVFSLLGRPAGVAATLLLIAQTLLVNYSAGTGQAFDLKHCVQTSNHTEGFPSECASLGRFTSSGEALFSKILCTMFASVFAWIYDSNRRSALKRMKEALRQKEKVNASLRQATNAKTAFLANMSHELRTPMHGIIAMAKDLMDMRLSADARDSARIVSDCADHLLGLVNDILDFARIESNQLELEAIPLSVADEVEKAVSLHAAMAKKKRVGLVTHVDVAEGAVRLGDPLRFRQILINLLSNAIKFTPEGGRVTVTASTSPTEPETISVKVEDTGIGIPAHGLEHIFKSFSQLDASVGRKFGGSGLGLAISKKLCHAMHGEIQVTSTVGVGSVFEFSVRLPYLLPEPPASPSPSSLGRPDDPSPCELLEGTKVLVVEDNAINQKVATKMLTSLGCHVTIAGDGEAAVDMFEREAFDVILMDVQMPVMDGFQATARIRCIELQVCTEEGEEEMETKKRRKEGRTKREGRVPIVALTASATRDYEAECLEKGMDRFLTKPFRKETLQATLVDILLRTTTTHDPNRDDDPRLPPSSPSSPSSSLSLSSSSSSVPKD